MSSIFMVIASIKWFGCSFNSINTKLVCLQLLPVSFLSLTPFFFIFCPYHRIPGWVPRQVEHTHTHSLPPASILAHLGDNNSNLARFEYQKCLHKWNVNRKEWDRGRGRMQTNTRVCDGCARCVSMWYNLCGAHISPDLINIFIATVFASFFNQL